MRLLENDEDFIQGKCGFDVEDVELDRCRNEQESGMGNESRADTTLISLEYAIQAIERRIENSTRKPLCDLDNDCNECAFERARK